MAPAETGRDKPERRVALVIGNGAYANAPPLDNPPNDARAMAAMLQSLDFEVVDGIDLDVDAMDGKINAFAGRIEQADTALFYYAGHGLQVDGENYLVPIDAALDNEGQLQRQTIRLQDQLNMMAGRAAVSILLLDCCRDNPFVRSLAGSRPNRTRGGVARGLAEIGTDDGAFIAFATGPGSVARDGAGEHSPFTEALLQHIATPGSSLADIMTDVTARVKAATDKQQVPWYHSSLSDRFYFRRKAEPVPPPTPQPETRSPEPPPKDKTPVDPEAERTTQKPRPGPSRGLIAGIVMAGLAAAGGLVAYYQGSLAGKGTSTTTGDAGGHGAGQPARTAAQLAGDINDLDVGKAQAISAFLLDPASSADDRQRLLKAVTGAAQYQLFTIPLNAPLPATCRTPTPPRPATDKDIPVVCSGLDAGGQSLLLGILAAMPAALWADPRFEAERKLALLATADASSSPSGMDASSVGQLKDRLGAGKRPGDLVTLQFAGTFLRGNAQLIMDRLVAFGWNLKGVDRNAGAAGANEIRYGSAQGAGADAAALAADLALQGLSVAPKPAASVGAKAQLDIYVSTPLTLWTEKPPAFAWCYQEFDGAKPQDKQYLLACHPSKPTCLDARGQAPTKRQSACTFQQDPAAGAPGLKSGGWGGSWFVEAGVGLSSPFPVPPL